MAKGLKFRNKLVEGLYYPYSENKGADQLRGYREADLRLCFRICKIQFSHDAAHIFHICCTEIDVLGISDLVGHKQPGNV